MNKTRTAGVFYLLTIVTGIYALVVRGTFAKEVGLIGGGCYLVVTVLLYYVFKPVNRTLSLLAAVVSVTGIAAGPLGLTLSRSLAFFGVYCLLIGYLIIKSTFAPRLLGVLMAFAGVGWLTFLSSRLAHSLYPYNLAPGLIGEGALTVWLLAARVKE
jgi:hypothetical protein